MREASKKRTRDVSKELLGVRTGSNSNKRKRVMPTGRNTRNSSNKGLPETRPLFHYPPHLKCQWSPEAWTGNRHTCQICSLRGKIFDGKYRNGSQTGVPYANRMITCRAPNCKTRYCSHECYNLWHYGVENTPTTEEWLQYAEANASKHS